MKFEYRFMLLVIQFFRILLRGAVVLDETTQRMINLWYDEANNFEIELILNKGEKKL